MPSTFSNTEEFMEYMEQLIDSNDNGWSKIDKAFALGALIIVELVDESPAWADEARIEIQKHKSY